jgi:hypothetical protein
MDFRRLVNLFVVLAFLTVEGIPLQGGGEVAMIEEAAAPPKGITNVPKFHKQGYGDWNVIKAKIPRPAEGGDSGIVDKAGSVPKPGPRPVNPLKPKTPPPCDKRCIEKAMKMKEKGVKILKKLASAKTDWKKAEKLSKPEKHRLKPKFVAKNGQDMTFVDRIIGNEKSAQKEKEIKMAQRVLASAWKLTVKPDPPSRSFKEEHANAMAAKGQLKTQVAALQKRMNKAAAQKLVQSVAIKNSYVQRKSAKYHAARAVFLAAQSKVDADQAAVASLASRALKRAEKKRKKADNAVHKQKKARKAAVAQAAVAVEEMRQRANVSGRPVLPTIKPRTAKEIAAEITKAMKKKKKAEKLAAKNKKAAKQKKGMTKVEKLARAKNAAMKPPVSVVRAMKELGVKTGMRIEVAHIKSGKASKAQPDKANAARQTAATVKKMKKMKKKVGQKDAVNFAQAKEKIGKEQFALKKKMAALSIKSAIKSTKTYKKRVAVAAEKDQKAKAKEKAAKKRQAAMKKPKKRELAETNADLKVLTDPIV